MKFKIFMSIVLWLLLATYFVGVMESYDAGNFGVSNPVGSIDEGSGNVLSQIWAMLKTFKGILFFEIDGLPAVFVILAFQVPTFGLLYMVIDVIKDLVPFT